MSGTGRPPLRVVVQVAIASGPITLVAPGDPQPPPEPPEIVALCNDSTIWVQDPADPTGWHLLPTVPGTRHV